MTYEDTVSRSACTVFTGSGFGYFIFGAVNRRNQEIFTKLHTQVYSPYTSQTGLTIAANAPPTIDVMTDDVANRTGNGLRNSVS